MKQVDPPPPLDAGPDTPEELRAVLRALGREGPGRGTLERVARELGPFMDAAPGLSAPVVEAARTGGTLLAARALAALLALGGAAYLVQRAWVEPDAPRALAAKVEAAAPVEVAAAEEVEQVEHVAPAVPIAHDEAPIQRVRHHRSRSKRARSAAPVVSSAPEAAAAAVESAAVESAAIEPVAVEPVVRVAEVPPAEEPAAKKPAPAMDEFELLWQARTKIRRDPAAALALLDEHAGRFASGQLAPEREVLAVEALRALARTEEAEARLRRFRSRYPGSIHLRRLQKGE